MKDKIYKSKIGSELWLPLALIVGILTTAFIITAFWIGLLISLLIVVFFVTLFIKTSYKITITGRLIIRCWIFEVYDIDISDIIWVRRIVDWSNAPAFSIDRLEIEYKGGRVMVSPKKREQFIFDLKRMNSRL